MFRGLSNHICPLYVFGCLLHPCPRLWELVPTVQQQAMWPQVVQKLMIGEKWTTDRKEALPTRWLGTYKLCGLALKDKLCQSDRSARNLELENGVAVISFGWWLLGWQDILIEMPFKKYFGEGNNKQKWLDSVPTKSFASPKYHG